MTPKGPAKDNILTIMGDAKLAAIDARLVLGAHAEDVAHSRAQTVAKAVAEFYKRERAKKGVALLFLDVGTPKTVEPLEFLAGAEVEDTTGGDALGVEDSLIGDEEDAAALASGDYEGSFNMYEALKKALIARGVKSHEIAFIHQARNAAERLALFQAAQEGTIRVLIASTDKGGLGMNIQDKLGMIVEVDAPRAMRPGDIRQRHGRGIRQGNTYDEIEILRFVTKGSTDEWLYGLLGKKQGMITDFMRGELDEYEDDDPTTMSLEEAEVRATNDPRKIELLTLNTSLPRLEAQAISAERAIAEAQADAARETAALPGRQQALAVLSDWTRDHFKKLAGDDFAMTIGDQTFTSRVDANKALIEALKPIAAQAMSLDVFHTTTQPWQTVGEVRGLPIVARPVVSRYRQAHEVALAIDADAAGEAEIPIGEITAGISGKANATFGEGRNLSASIQDRYNAIPAGIPALERQILSAEERLARVEKLLGSPSDAPKKIAAARARIAAIEAELRAESAIKDAEAQRAHREDEQARRHGGGEASEGDYATIPTSEGSVTIPLRPIEFPELVTIARELQKMPQVVRRFRGEGTRGMFTAGGIRLAADLFKKGNEQQLAATLAHEIGHLADWLPDYTLKRGNLLGHLRTLTGFLKGQYTAADGTTIKNAEVRAELKALSAKWRPWDRAAATDSFRKYRDSAKELYADAISVLLNNPGLAQNDAPIFFEQFFAELDEKPDVKRAFFGMWSLLSGTREELVARREAGVEHMFAEGNTESIDLLKKKRNERKARYTNIRQRIYAAVVDKHQPFISRLETDREVGRTIAPEDDPFFALSERAYRLAGQAKAWLQTQVQPVLESLLATDLTWVDFGKVLMYERIIAGDRSELANPDGLSPAAAQELHDTLMQRLTPEQKTVLRQGADSFRAAVKQVARRRMTLDSIPTRRGPRSTRTRPTRPSTRSSI